jgi:hypothetical protein
MEQTAGPQARIGSKRRKAKVPKTRPVVEWQTESGVDEGAGDGGENSLAPCLGHVSKSCGPTAAVICDRTCESVDVQVDVAYDKGMILAGPPVWTRLELIRALR